MNSDTLRNSPFSALKLKKSRLAIVTSFILSFPSYAFESSAFDIVFASDFSARIIDEKINDLTIYPNQNIRQLELNSASRIDSQDSSSFLPLSVPLANNYQAGMDISDYWYSEKYDGVRAMWDGETLRTRTGLRINAPIEFIKSLPNVALDGELWAGRGNFNTVQKTVLDDVPDASAWQDIIYMVFDRPDVKGDFAHRYQALQSTVKDLNGSTYVKIVKHAQIPSDIGVEQLLDTVEKSQGEGLILRDKHSYFRNGRSNALLKVKSYEDEEAIVIGYKSGKGKYKGLVGALRVKGHGGKIFYIGSGLSDADRHTPPELGSQVTYRFNGETVNGLPRFARFIRVRNGDI